jgi:hypothetical protein
MNFRELVEAAQERNRSTLAIGLAPTLNKLPYEIQRFDEPFLPYGKAVIDATADLACAYVFHLGAYLALGAAGAVALERTIAYVPTGVVKILHGPFANSEYVRATFEEGFGADAVTIAYQAHSAMLVELINAYTQDAGHGALIEVRREHGLVSLMYPADMKAIWSGQGGESVEQEDYNLITLWRSNINIHWYDNIHSQGDNFRQEIRAAAEKVRRSPDQSA